MVVFESKLGSPTPKTSYDVVFVVEGTALSGAYLDELKQAYILPTLEHFNGGPVNEKDCESASNYAVYGLVVFHAADILPGYVTEAYGPITTAHKLLKTLENVQFAGGFGEAVSYVGEGLATALQCFQDITDFRSSQLEIQAKKHVILICNCKPYGLPVTESVGTDEIYRGMTAEQLAEQMWKTGVHLSIIGPRKIPALISLFDRGGGGSSSEKTYENDVRHLVLLNGFQLQENPVTPKQVFGVPTPVMNPSPVVAPPVNQQASPAPTSSNQQLPQSPGLSQPQQPVPISIHQQPQQYVPTSMHQQPQPPTPRPVAPTPPPPISSLAPIMPSPSQMVPLSSISMQQQQSMSPATDVAMAQLQAGDSGPSIMMSQVPNINVGMGHVIPSQQQQQQSPHQQVLLIRNRAPVQQMQNIRPLMQMQTQQMSQSPNQMGHAGQPSTSQAQMNAPTPNGSQQPQLVPGQQIMANQAQLQMNINHQQQQQLNKQFTQLQHNVNSQQIGQQYQNQQANPQMNQQMLGQNQMTTSIRGPRLMSGPASQQHQHEVNQPQPARQTPVTSQILNIPSRQITPEWLSQISAASSMPQIQKLPQSQVPSVRMTNANQPQVRTPVQLLQAQISNQQPILSTGIQSSSLQQQLQQNQPRPQHTQPPAHSTLLAQLRNLPTGSPQAQGPQQIPPQIQTGISNRKERHAIWTGTLEWNEKSKDGQKVMRQVPFTAFANVVNGVPEVQGDNWPPKLMMQLVPNGIVGKFAGSFLARDVKTVVFHPQNCDTLNLLTRVMELGHAGCVHFTGPTTTLNPECSVSVLMLLYSKEKQTYMGFIPADQVGFVDRIRKVIQLQKQQHAALQVQRFPGPGGMPPTGLMSGPSGQQQHLQQPGLLPSQAGMLQRPPQQQPGLVQQQTMVQVQQQQPPISPLAQQLAQSPQGNMGQSQVTAQLSQQPGQAQQLQQQLQRQQQQVQNNGMGGGNPESTQNPSQSTNQYQVDQQRQQNLLTIQQLQQTLQAAQQKELQFQQSHHPAPGPGGHSQQPVSGSSQIHILQVGQQLAPNTSGQQQQLQHQQIPRQMMTQGMGQVRMMRTSISQANPGLRHLLQQQPGQQNYRMQIQMQQPRMQGQMSMPGAGQMQGLGGSTQTNQQMTQAQIEDLGILDLLNG